MVRHVGTGNNNPLKLNFLLIMMNKILDLRFLIGLFFLLTGLMLVIYFLTESIHQMKSERINLWSGLFFSGFGLAMLLLSLISRKK